MDVILGLCCVMIPYQGGESAGDISKRVTVVMSYPGYGQVDEVLTPLAAKVGWMGRGAALSHCSVERRGVLLHAVSHVVESTSSYF